MSNQSRIRLPRLTLPQGLRLGFNCHGQGCKRMSHGNRGAQLPRSGYVPQAANEPANTASPVVDGRDHPGGFRVPAVPVHTTSGPHPIIGRRSSLCSPQTLNFPSLVLSAALKANPFRRTVSKTFLRGRYPVPICDPSTAFACQSKASRSMTIPFRPT